jgi:lipoprotein-anchoring transpeptidase ErfK/SrfK
MIVHNGRLVRVFNISSGGGYQYTQEGATYTATTPKGSFHVYREVSGWDKGPLGAMWQPKYFYSGYALHGSLDVPPYPASHGCIRFSVDAMTYLWNSNLIPIGTRVMIYQ